MFTAQQAAQLLADGWGTRVLSHDDSSGSMRMVQLPQVYPRNFLCSVPLY
jgi:hypothetical protein